VDRLRLILEECKLYGMILAISAIVWICGFRARIEQRWHDTEWLAPPSDVHSDAFVGIDLNDGGDEVME
jgi:hypothetical protein